MKIAWAMIVKGTDEEAESLARCLQYIAPYVDGLFITRTTPEGEEPNEKVANVVEKYGGFLSDFTWVDDFAEARNFNFSQVPKEYDYVGWCDADDVIRGADKLRGEVENNSSDVYTMWYLYAFDEYGNPVVVHPQIRLIRNDGCMKWRDPIHEYLEQTREVTTSHIESVDVLHFTGEERVNENKDRNLRIAQKHHEENPEDLRANWNYAAALQGYAPYDEEYKRKSLEQLLDFAEKSQSPAEKYLAYVSIADLYWTLDEQNNAFHYARWAIGYCPFFPDAYFKVGSYLHEINENEEAKTYFLYGLNLKPPYYQMKRYNPREYDYQPLKTLGYIYVNLMQPKPALECFEACAKITPGDPKLEAVINQLTKEVEKDDEAKRVYTNLKDASDKKVKKDIEELPKQVRQHPLICSLYNRRFPKKESSGKDIVYYLGPTNEQWTPESVKETGIGGSEEAVINLARRWVEKGYNVKVYANPGNEGEYYDGVWYAPYWQWNPQSKEDVTIMWRVPAFLDGEINSDKVVLDLHDVVPEGELNERRLENVDTIFVKSNYHRNLFPNVPDEKFTIIPNGIESSQFNELGNRYQYMLVNTSAPDRSFPALLDCFEKVKEQVSEAELYWAYGWGTFDAAADQTRKAWKHEIRDRMRQMDGFHELGRVSHEKVAELMKQANVFAYPTQFAEIDCISLSKAMAAGATPVTTDVAALGEKQGFGHFIHAEIASGNRQDWSLHDEQAQEAWVEAVVKELQEPSVDREAMSKYARETYDWDSIADRWVNTLWS